MDGWTNVWFRDWEVLLPHTVIKVDLIQGVWLVQQTGQRLVQ